ncbi:MAG: sigma 54-interacting transcriptional regulator [Polyangiaceae bacterium]
MVDRRGPARETCRPACARRSRSGARSGEARASREAREAPLARLRDAPRLAGTSEGRGRPSASRRRPPAPLPTLLTGEDGTGRDAVARFIHDRSRRATRAFVSFSCAQLADDPEGERLFGARAPGEEGVSASADIRRRGSAIAGSADGGFAQYSDEDQGEAREGLVDLADRGTLFLDHVEALPVRAQDRLLALMSRIRSAARADAKGTGADLRAIADVRILAGTSANLAERTRAGLFREELYYRLRALTIHLPPLRERTEDIALLAYAYLEMLRAETGRDIRRISPEALRLLRHHTWDGNARELRSALAHGIALARGEVILPADLPMSARPPVGPPEVLFDDELTELPYVEARKRALTEFEKRYTRLVVGAEDGNLSGAARRAGMDRSNFKRLLRRTKGGAE